MELFVNGVTIHYETYGSGDALLLLHGNGESSDIFDRAVPLLAERFTVFTVDTRGHGKSSPVSQFHYRDMAEDVIALIKALSIQKPVLYGFSDGGIVALLVGMLAPDLCSRLIVSGVNIFPRGLNADFLRRARRDWKTTKDPLTELIITEPDLTFDDLKQVVIPVDLIVGKNDLIRARHTLKIARALPCCSLHVLAGETHESYIVHSEKIAKILSGLLS